MIRTSDDAAEVYAAILAVRDAVGSKIMKDAKAGGGRYAYTYATLGGLLEHIGDAMVAAGLWWIASQTVDGVTVRIVHTCGQWVECSTPTIAADGRDPQKVGAAFTYGRRYGLIALLGLSAEDDDGLRAGRPKKETDDMRRARQAEHDPSWSRDKGRFFRRLNELGQDYRALCDILDTRDKPRPSCMTQDQREATLAWIEARMQTQPNDA